ncbi:MAG: hypothetical protein ACHQZS_07980 [Candidatus Binatales bacterium]
MPGSRFSDFVDLNAWRAQSRHLSGLLAAMITYAVADAAAKWMVSKKWLPYFDDLEGFMLLGLVLFFGLRLIWELIKHKDGTGSLHAFMAA